MKKVRFDNFIKFRTKLNCRKINASLMIHSAIKAEGMNKIKF